MYLSVIIPAYREASRIAPTLEKVYAYLRDQPYASEVIVVDDGSPDNTVEVVNEQYAKLNSVARASRPLPSADGDTRVAGETPALPTFRLIELGTNAGKGAAVQAGMLVATGEIRVFTDADLSTPIYEIDKVISAIEKEKFEVVIGSRALEGRALVKVHQPWYREMMGRFFNVFVQIFVFRGILDTQCGFKAFTANATEKLFGLQKVMGFSFDVEILYLAKKHNFRMKEIAVEWYNDERTTVGALSDSTRMFLEILRIRRLHK